MKMTVLGIEPGPSDPKSSPLKKLGEGGNIIVIPELPEGHAGNKTRQK